MKLQQIHLLLFQKQAFLDGSTINTIPAPVFYDVTYDPRHPDADWTGLVKKDYQKKHVPPTRSPVIGPCPDGSALTISSSASPRPSSKRIVGPMKLQESQELIFPSPNNSSNNSKEAWKTTTQLQAERAPTSHEYFCEMRRQKGCGKKLVKPSHLLHPPCAAAPGTKAVGKDEERKEENEEEDDTLIGYRAPLRIYKPSSSLLAGLGKKIRQSSHSLSTGEAKLRNT